MKRILLLIMTIFFLIGCSDRLGRDRREIILPYGGYPHIMEHGKNYYLTFQNITVDSIFILSASSVPGLKEKIPTFVWAPEDGAMKNIYSPELHRVEGKWYIYFEADNGVNTDYHQLYVLENPGKDPLTGEWTLHGPIITDKEWNFGLHPTTAGIAGKQYLLWSGWPKRRTETETQCIYIAEMENPWTLKSERVMISTPEYEWERQWINPDGSRTAYPIYVNENPEVMISPDGRHVVVGYSASGIWTEYTTLGILHAGIDSDLLDPDSWRKEPEPFFRAEEGSDIFGVSNISMVRIPGSDRYHLFYQTKFHPEDDCSRVHYDIRWKEIGWSEKGIPEFGTP